jgi:thiol:disulfide interchange protein DsbD
MPCTYPMIPITVSFFTKQAEQRGGNVLPLALIYGGGIIVSFLVVGLLVGLIGLDIVNFATNGWVNLALAAMFVFFALSLFGLVELRPPQFLLRQATDASRKGGVLGVFLMGMTLCVTSFTCTAPALGAMLAFGTQTGDMGRLLLGMGVFGLTMALPFVVLSLVPGRLPRGGAWMNTAKVMFGFVELAAALKFFSITDVSWNLQALPREMFLTLWAGLFLVAGVYCFGLVKLKGESGEIGGGRFLTGIASIVFGFYCLHGANGYRLDNFIMVAFEPPYLASRVSSEGHEIVNDDFDAAVDRAQESGRLLLVNFTGYN